MKTIIRYLNDVAKQIPKIFRIAKDAFTNPKSETAVVIGVVVSVATAVEQATVNGKLNWTALIGLLGGFLTRPRVSPSA